MVELAAAANRFKDASRMMMMIQNQSTTTTTTTRRDTKIDSIQDENSDKEKQFSSHCQCSSNRINQKKKTTMIVCLLSEQFNSHFFNSCCGSVLGVIQLVSIAAVALLHWAETSCSCSERQLTAAANLSLHPSSCCCCFVVAGQHLFVYLYRRLFE